MRNAGRLSTEPLSPHPSSSPCVEHGCVGAVNGVRRQLGGGMSWLSRGKHKPNSRWKGDGSVRPRSWRLRPPVSWQAGSATNPWNWSLRDCHRNRAALSFFFHFIISPPALLRFQPRLTSALHVLLTRMRPIRKHSGSSSARLKCVWALLRLRARSRCLDSRLRQHRPPPQQRQNFAFSRDGSLEKFETLSSSPFGLTT